MSQLLPPLLWTVVCLLALIFLQRWMHRHLHGLSLLLMGQADRALILYAIALLPGVILHEVSHWIMATLLGVRTGKLSLMPRVKQDGAVQLGYVEYYKGGALGFVRESLIGAAPLMTGTAVILLVGFRVFDVSSLLDAARSGSIDSLVDTFGNLFTTKDVLVWIYLLFAVSNAMLPSASDRRAWPGFIAFMLALSAAAAILGYQDLLLRQLSVPVTTLFVYMAIGLSIAIAVDLVVMLLIAPGEWLVSRLRGVAIVYDDIGQAKRP